MRYSRFVVHRSLFPLLLAASGCGDDRAFRSLTDFTNADTATRTPASVSPSMPADASSPESDDTRRLPGMDCLLNSKMVRRKVIVTSPGVSVLDRPGGRPTGTTAIFFRPYFLFAIDEIDGEPRYYQVGPTPRREMVLGWIPASQAALWDYRVGARQYRGGSGRSLPLVVYSEKAPLVELVKTGRTEIEPIARAVLQDDQSLMPWPIAEVHYETIDGKVHELVRLLFLGEFHHSDSGIDFGSRRVEAGYSSERIQKIQLGVRMLDICFVVDNTHSTQPFLEKIRETMDSMARLLQGISDKVDVAFGLVLFRDYIPEIMFPSPSGPSVTRAFALRSLDSFLEVVSPLREADASSIDWPEAVYDGLDIALKDTAWRGDGLSQRVIVLIGDNSAHEPGSARNPRGIGIPEIVETARSPEKHVTIFSLSIRGGGGDDEQNLHRKQFTRVAEGTGGTCHDLADANKVVERIRTILETESAVVHERSTIVDAKAAGKLDDLLATKEVDVRRVTAVMEFLRDFGDIDIERIGPGRPTFASGWVLTAINGVPTIEKHVYVARAELDYLLGELNHVLVGLSPGFAKSVLGVAVKPRTGDYDQPETWSARLQSLGVPCGPTSILTFTPDQAAHMPEERRAMLRERIARSVIPKLVNARNDNDSFQFIDDLEFGWVSESLFP
jgi:hypothetical protein